jgi:recombination protein RecA
VRVKVVKNKCAAPFRTADFDILFSEGISYESTVIDLGIESHIIEKQGSWLSYKDEKLGQGRENTRQTLKGNAKLLKEIENEIRAHVSAHALEKIEA